jgi:hypothetical protein
MMWELSWLGTLIVFGVALVLGIGSSLVFRHGPIRTIWALVVTLVFIVSGMAAVIFGYSWMFTDETRLLAQAVAVGAALTGIIYAMRAPN